MWSFSSVNANAGQWFKKIGLIRVLTTMRISCVQKKINPMALAATGPFDHSSEQSGIDIHNFWGMLTVDVGQRNKCYLGKILDKGKLKKRKYGIA